MNATQQDIMDMLKHGHIKPVTLINELENLIPGVTRNFTCHYNSLVKQALFNKTYPTGKLHSTLGEPDGYMYEHRITSKMSGNKSPKLEYEFGLLITDFESNCNTITMSASPTFQIASIRLKCNKSVETTSKQHFFDLICGDLFLVHVLFR